MIHKGFKVTEMVAEQKRDLGLSPLVRIFDPLEGVAVRDDDQVRGGYRQHVFDDAIDVFITEAVAIAEQRAIRSTNRRSEISE